MFGLVLFSAVILLANFHSALQQLSTIIQELLLWCYDILLYYSTRARIVWTAAL
jgi:hypothetical protein